MEKSATSSAGCFMIDWGNSNTHLIFHRSNITSECRCRARGKKNRSAKQLFLYISRQYGNNEDTFSIWFPPFVTQNITSKHHNRYLMTDSALLLPPLKAQRWNDSCLWTFYTKRPSEHHEHTQNSREVSESVLFEAISNKTWTIVTNIKALDMHK